MIINNTLYLSHLLDLQYPLGSFFLFLCLDGSYQRPGSAKAKHSSRSRPFSPDVSGRLWKIFAFFIYGCKVKGMCARQRERERWGKPSLYHSRATCRELQNLERGNENCLGEWKEQNVPCNLRVLYCCSWDLGFVLNTMFRD
jgi:hypothetical protein